MGGNKNKGGNKKSGGGGGPGVIQKTGKPGNNARESDDRREKLRRRLQMRLNERRVDDNNPETILNLALSYANSGKIADACETFKKVSDELIEPYRERFACLLLDNEEADIAREQIEKSNPQNIMTQTANTFTLALIEYIAFHRLNESSMEDAIIALKKAHAVNSFVMELLLWQDFDELLGNDDLLRKLPDSEKMTKEEAALAYCICWGQLEIWSDAEAHDFILRHLWGENIPKLEEPTSQLLSKTWNRCRQKLMSSLEDDELEEMEEEDLDDMEIESELEEEDPEYRELQENIEKEKKSEEDDEMGDVEVEGKEN